MDQAIRHRRNAHFKISVRQLLLLVMAVAIILGSAQMARRSASYRKKAALHADIEWSARKTLHMLEQLEQDPRYRFLETLRGERFWMRFPDGTLTHLPTPWHIRRVIIRHARLR